MSHHEYFREIESLEFQIQFSVVGGLRILQLAMERHPTLLALRLEIARSAQLADAVFDRIIQLLEIVETETQLSYDESIAAYLFCLSHADQALAQKASEEMLESGGLFWSVQLAMHIIKATQTEAA